MPNTYGDAATIKQRAGLAYTDLGLANSGALDALVAGLQQRVTDAVERYCRRDFTQHAAVTELYDGKNYDTLNLRGYPVISITSVTVNNVLQDAATYRLKPTPNGGDDAGLLQRKNMVWQRGWANISIVYTWGYASVPLVVQGVVEDVAVRVLLDAARAYKTKGAMSIGMDGFESSWEKLSVKLDDIDKVALDPLRSMIVT